MAEFLIIVILLNFASGVLSLWVAFGKRFRPITWKRFNQALILAAFNFVIFAHHLVLYIRTTVDQIR